MYVYTYIHFPRILPQQLTHQSMSSSVDLSQLTKARAAGREGNAQMSDVSTITTS